MLRIKIWVLIVCAISASISNAANVEPFLENACPEAWTAASSVVPVVGASTDPWKGKADDRAKGRASLAKDTGITETVDAVPTSLDDLSDDALTIASACLEYRNLLVDGKQYFPVSPSVTRREDNGWIPATF